MRKFSITIFFLLMIGQQLWSQVLPKDGCRLNYRLVGFSFPGDRSNHRYKIDIATGNYYNEDSFKKHVIKTISSNTNKIIIELPFFGADYTWRITNIDRKKQSNSEFHHFGISISSSVDTNTMRLKILKHADTYKDAYLLMDGTKVMYDMEGHPLWFLPVVDTVPADKIWGFGDMNYTKQGTITYLTTARGGQIYEANFNGKVVWRGPNNGKVNGDTVEYYNHEFVRFPNGHYMVLGAQFIYSKLPGAVDSAFLKNNTNRDIVILKHADNAYYQRLRFGTVIEYDDNSNIVWTWKSSEYFAASDIYDHTNAAGFYDIDNVHENSFYFDEKNKVIYIGFRDISRVIKVGYPSGQVLKEFGNLYIRGVKDTANEMFCWQHSCKHSPNGYMYLFNNNTCHHGSMPRITIVRDSTPDDGSTKKMWEYECTIDGVESNHQYQFANGGSVTELPDQSIFVNMSHELYTKVFIIDRDKNYDWSAIPERWNEKEKKWAPVFQYRASIINRQDLERMIWNEMNNR